MQKLLAVLASLIFLSVPFVYGNEDTHHKEGTSVWKDENGNFDKEKMTEYVKHHTQDSHDFTIFSDETEHKHYGFALPVILWDGGLHVFMSSAFEHGEKVAESNGNYYKLVHGKIYKTDAEGTIKFNKEGHPENAKPLDLSLTKSVLVTLIMGLLMFLLFRKVAKSYSSSLAPKGSAKFVEPLILFVRDEIAIPNIGHKHHKRYMVHLLTVFFLIWFLNLAGMTPLGINVTGNIAVTFTLAIITFIITQVSGNANYWGHIFWMPGVPTPMKVVLAPIELLGIFIKPFALMIRLYANMLAGHIVLGSLIIVVFEFSNWGAKGAFVGLAFFLNIIELLVAFLQAYIFTMLTALYFGSAVAEHDDHH